MIVHFEPLPPCLHILFVTVNAACFQISDIKMHSESY